MEPASSPYSPGAKCMCGSVRRLSPIDITTVPNAVSTSASAKPHKKVRSDSGNEIANTSTPNKTSRKPPRKAHVASLGLGIAFLQFRPYCFYCTTILLLHNGFALARRVIGKGGVEGTVNARYRLKGPGIVSRELCSSNERGRAASLARGGDQRNLECD